MAYYGQIQTMKGAAIGTIVPWTGGLSEVPDGWLICDGGSRSASDFPLLAQAIGSRYTPGDSDLVTTGANSFPNYGGSFSLPRLTTNNALIDIEKAYLGSSSVLDPSNANSRTEAKDDDAQILLDPFIGDIESVNVQLKTQFTDVTIDVVWEFNEDDRTGYTGKITGNTKEDGDAVVPVYIAPRKLGRKHVKRHNHPGAYESVEGGGDGGRKPGDGVVPYEDITYSLLHSSTDTESGGDRGDLWWFGWTDSYNESGRVNRGPGVVAGDIRTLYNVEGDSGNLATDTNGIANNRLDGWDRIFQWPETIQDSPNGFGSGPNDVVVAHVTSESPPINMKPKYVHGTPITTQFLDSPQYDDGAFIDDLSNVPAGPGGNSFNVPLGYKNYYNREFGEEAVRGTFLSHPGYDFDPIGGDDPDNTIESHDHTEFEVSIDTSGLRPSSSITVDAIIRDQVELDNVSNRSALQIDMNTAQPTLGCIYIIRAY